MAGAKSKRIELTVSANCPKGMSAGHFRQLIKDQLGGGSGIYLSIYDQIGADTNRGVIKPRVGAARIVRD